ncbi:SGNH/GDSL hydrolase family protein [Actinoplanes subglobosus]|uniref:SGNH/GDSL hydrolase family protein n=1 Tax=Actinoplanes subglobosus TaxID=1547892 RepID=A0ABV8J886_9ACTN
MGLLGDSSAAGFGAPDHATALAGRFATALAAGLDRAVSWRVAARGGATARTVTALVPGLTDPATGWRPDLVVVAVGVNDTTRLRRPAAFQRDITRLLTALRTELATTKPQTPSLVAGITQAPTRITGPGPGPGPGPGTKPEPGLATAPGTGPVTGPGTGPVTGPGTGPVTGPGTGPVTGPGTGPGLGTNLVPVLLSGLPPVHRFPVLPAPARLLFGSHARRLDRRLAVAAAEHPAVHHLPIGDIPMDEPGLFASDGFHPAPPAYEIWGRLLAGQAVPLLT